MPRYPLNIVGGQRESRSRAVNAQLLLNWYAEIEGPNANSPAPLYPFPGLLKKTTAGNGPRRGSGAYWPSTNMDYIVSGSGFYEIDGNYAATLKGTLGTSTGWITITVGVSHLMIVDGAKAYSYTTAGTFAEITGLPIVPGLGMWNDNYFMLNEVDTGNWNISTLNDPTTGNWAALDTVTAEKRPDNLLRLAWLRGKPLAIGQYTSELYANTGAAFPFERYPNTVFSWGTPAVASVGEAKDSIFMVSRSSVGDVSVVKISYEEPQVISHPALNYQLSQGAFQDAQGWCYEQFGHTFYQLVLPTVGRVYLWDDNTQIWTERTTGTARHRGLGSHYMVGLGEQLVGDYENGNNYILDKSTYTDNGTFIERVMRSAPFSTKDRNTFRCNRIEAEFEEGVGNQNSPGNDPLVFIRWSWDGARTFSNWMTSPIGKIGEYDNVAAVHRCGHGRDLTVEVKVTEPIEAVLLGVYIDIEPGYH